MADAAHRLGTLWEQLCALPRNRIGEIVNGELYSSRRPAGAHARVASGLGVELGGPSIEAVAARVVGSSSMSPSCT